LEFAERSGLQPRDYPDIVSIRKRIAQAIGSDSFPPLSVPAEHYPHEWSPNAIVRLRSELDSIFASHGLTVVECAVALACTTGALINMTAQTVEPGITTTLALEIMIGTSRMAPLEKEL
jgi:hypothetical protein